MTDIWLQMKGPVDPGTAKITNLTNPDFKAAKLTIIIVVYYLPTLWQQRGGYEVTRLELHNLIMKLKKIKILEMAQILLSAY